MDSTLLTGLISWWEFNVISADQFILDKHGSNQLTVDGVTVGGGFMNVPASCPYPTVGAKDFRKGASNPFNPANQSFTIAIVARLSDITQSHAVFSKYDPDFGGWEIVYLFDEGEFRFHLQNGIQEMICQNFPEIDPNVFYAIIAWYDASQHTMFMQINNNDPGPSASQPVTFEVKSEVGFLSVGGNSDCGLIPYLGGDVTMAAYWSRLLTEAERTTLWNNGKWTLYSSLKSSNVIVSECQEIPCCKTDPYDFQIATTAAQVAALPQPVPVVNLCEPAVTVSIDPPSGTEVTFPLMVTLSTNRPDAVIYYTVNGSTPTNASTIYTFPFSIPDSTVIVRAIAIVEGCPGSTVLVAQYIQHLPPFKFSYLCDEPDLAGQWGQFAPNGRTDYHWLLQFSLTATTTILRIELYQLDSDGHWTTGQAWSTAQTIHPVELGGGPFVVFPLVIFEAAAQQNFAYTDSYGSFAAGDYLWDLYGQPAAPTYGLFKIIVFTDTGNFESIIRAVCGDPPPPCTELPANPTLTPLCYSMDVTIHEAVGLPFKLYRRDCISPDFTLIDSGTIATQPQTYHDTSLSPGQCVCYMVMVQFDPACPYASSNAVCDSVPCKPVVELTVDNVAPCPGETINLCWHSECIVGNLTASWGTPKAPNVDACEAVAIPGDATGQICYTLSGSNSCESASAQVCIDIGTPPLEGECFFTGLPAIDSYSDSFFIPYTIGCGLIGYGSGTPPSYAPWNGTFPRDVTSSCAWGGAKNYSPPTDITYFNGGCVLLDAVINVLSGVEWILKINAFSNTLTNIVVWEGIKTCGKTPLGIYTKTGGCATGPGSIAIV